MPAQSINSSFQFSSFNLNINLNNAGNSVGDNLLSRLDKIEKALGLNGDTAPIPILTGGFKPAGGFETTQRAPVELPVLTDGDQPAGALKAEGNKITTPGGYTIEVLGTSNWKITGPDGKSTEVWGDPHVKESDREGNAESNGGWDFHNNSTFALPDGTKINVTTVPGGAAGATVTGALEIISGNDRITVSDMEKGMGKIGENTHDGYAHANSFQGDVFVMGKESDDWSLGGKEILGSEGQGRSFKLGNDLPVGVSTTRGTGNSQLDRLTERFNMLKDKFANTLMNFFSRAFQPSSLGSNPYAGNTRSPWESSDNKYDRAQHRQNLSRNFQDLSKMFSILSRLSNLSDRISDLRLRTNQNV